MTNRGSATYCHPHVARGEEWESLPLHAVHVACLHVCLNPQATGCSSLVSGTDRSPARDWLRVETAQEVVCGRGVCGSESLRVSESGETALAVKPLTLMRNSSLPSLYFSIQDLTDHIPTGGRGRDLYIVIVYRSQLKSCRKQFPQLFSRHFDQNRGRKNFRNWLIIFAICGSAFPGNCPLAHVDAIVAPAHRAVLP